MTKDPNVYVQDVYLVRCSDFLVFRRIRHGEESALWFPANEGFDVRLFVLNQMSLP